MNSFIPLIFLLGLIFSVGTVSNVFAQLVVNPTANPTTLVNNILGSGITTSNEVFIGGTGAGVPFSAGEFTGGFSAGFTMDSGIILTSGDVSLAPVNNGDSSSGVIASGGDPSLANQCGSVSQDQTILDFDFQSQGGNLFFSYVFASEEYNEFTNSAFNDPFAFFLDGSNIAFVPGTVTPVSINTVNGGMPLGVGSTNPQFFNNNDPSDGGPFINIEYDGYTDIFVAQALNLSPGSHNIRLAISDCFDSILDSAVFIQSGSFTDGNFIGGKIIPIDTTSLIVAGAQSSTSWMIPVIVSVIGIGMLFVRKKE